VYHIAPFCRQCSLFSEACYIFFSSERGLSLSLFPVVAVDEKKDY